jgi:hypothetical protein
MLSMGSSSESALPSQPWTAQDERRMRRLLAEKLRRQRDERFRYFNPNPAQLRFIQEISRPGAFIVINAGGNGSGKTYGLIAVIAALCWPKMAPACFAADIFQDFKYPKRVWIVSNPGELGITGAIQSSIDELWPKAKYIASKNGRQYNSVFRTDTGWEIELKSTEQSITEFRGANVGVVALNEPIPEDIYRECLARTRKGGIMPGAMTSLDDEPWIVDGLLEKHDGKDYRILYGPVEDNCKDHTPGGTLSHDQIERILSKYPEDEQQARRTGRPLSLSGRVFKAFDRSVHVLKEDVRPPKGTAVYQVVDPAGGKPFAVVYAYVDAGGNLVIFDEWPNFEFFGAKDPGLNIHGYADMFRQKEVGFTVASRIIDRHYGNTHHKPGSLTLREDFGEADVEFSNSYDVGDVDVEVKTGILKVADYLAYNKALPIDSANHPRLMIAPSCKNTIESLAKWTWDPKSLLGSRTKPKDNHFKDFCDCVRYLVMANPEIETKMAWGDQVRPHYGVGT